MQMDKANFKGTSIGAFRNPNKAIRVLYSFPHKIGASRICYTAWQQVAGIAAAGAEVIVFPASIGKALPSQIQVEPTLARGRYRLPNRLLKGLRYFALHDYIVARRLEKLQGHVDVIHAWPLGSLRTLRVARKLGIPTVLERCNAHTRFAYTVVKQECERLGVTLPPDHEHAFNDDILRKEEQEYNEAFRILCPSDFVMKTFLNQGFPRGKLLRHIYGFDPVRFYPDLSARAGDHGLKMLFVGANAIRKGLHYALEAWLRSPASRSGTFQIAGELPPGYAEKLAGMLAHPTVRLLGHCQHVPELMRTSDVLVLPSLEEGSALVVGEAMASGCVPLISDASAGVCKHLDNALLHRAGDVNALLAHISLVDTDRQMLARLRLRSIESASHFTWSAAGVRLLAMYSDAMTDWQKGDIEDSTLTETTPV